MSGENRQRARRVFMEIADVPQAERRAALDGACAGDAALRAEVEALLRAEEEAGGFMASPTGEMSEDARPTLAVGATGPAGSSAWSAAPGEQEGQMIGRYKLLQPIGEGGFGSVWMAEQREPVKRRVAVKVIKLGMDTRQVIARFEAERQALAMMDHPNIARVLDAGSTEAGRPYFVMEYIKGVPILEYCDRERLDTRARLELFAQVCQAIQHAHQKGIIHRDVKPSNVLVTMHDGVAVPKVIDFGIAKATSSELTQKTLFTEHRQMIGTPAYMSPEQAEMSGLDIDTRSDIYSLGVLLYELLTGTTPFAAEDLLSKGFAEMMRIIREVEPRKPSTRLSTLGQTGTRTAEQRKAGDVGRLAHQLRGDLDWIVMKCLEKDRTRRYETASGLASDIRRHLADEPVTAGPPSAGYRLRKFVRRNRGKVAMAGVAGVLVVLGLAGTTGGMVWAMSEKARADLAAQAELAAKVEAQENARTAEGEARRARAAQGEEAKARRTAETIGQFMTTALNAGDAEQAGGGQAVTVLEAMDRAVADIDSGRFKDEPETEALLRHTIAMIMLNNGRAAEAEKLSAAALEGLRGVRKGDHRNVAALMNGLARVLAYSGREKEAEPLFREVLGMLVRLDSGDEEAAATAMNNLGFCLMRQGRLAEAAALIEKSIAMAERAGDSPGLAKALDNLGKLRLEEERIPDAEALTLRALEMRRRLYRGAGGAAGGGGDHPDLSVGLSTLADLRFRMGRKAEAEALAREGLAMDRRLFKGDNPVILLDLASVGNIVRDQGRFDEAEALYLEGVAMGERLYREGHHNLAMTLGALGVMRVWMGKGDEAAAVLERALEMERRLHSGDHPFIATAMEGLSRARLVQDRAREAVALGAEALEMRRRLFAGDHRDVLNSLLAQGGMLGRLGRAAEAEPLLVEAVAMARRVVGEGHPTLRNARDGLATNYWREGKLDLSIPEFESLLAERRKLLEPGDVELLGTMANLGINYKDAGRSAEAIPLLEEARRGVGRVPALGFVKMPLLEAYAAGADPAKPGEATRVVLLVKEMLPEVRAELSGPSLDLAAVLAQMGTALVGVRAWDEAQPLLAECLEIRQAEQPEDWRTFNTRSMLGGALLGKGRHAEAEPLLLAGYEGMKARAEKMPEAAKGRLAQAADRLVELYAATGRAEEEKKWREERAGLAPTPKK